MTRRRALAWGALGVLVGGLGLQLLLHAWRDHQDLHAMIRIINRASTATPSR